MLVTALFVYKAISLQFGQSMTKHDIAFIQVFGKNRHIVQSDNTLVFSFLKNKNKYINKNMY